MSNMLNDVPSKNITPAFNVWKECGEIAATALTKLAEQQLGLADARVNMGSSQLKLLSEPNGGGEFWSRQAKLAGEYNDLAVDHMRKAVAVVTESTRACFTGYVHDRAARKAGRDCPEGRAKWAQEHDAELRKGGCLSLRHRGQRSS